MGCSNHNKVGTMTNNQYDYWIREWRKELSDELKRHMIKMDELYYRKEQLGSMISSYQGVSKHDQL
jgi:hypothetical protein